MIQLKINLLLYYNKRNTTYYIFTRIWYQGAGKRPVAQPLYPTRDEAEGRGALRYPRAEKKCTRSERSERRVLR